jgi:hypothetical protein
VGVGQPSGVEFSPGRAVRVALMTAAALTAIWSAVAGYLRAHPCRPAPYEEFGCLGYGVVEAALGLVATVVALALILAGRGAAHALLGTLVTLVVDYVVVGRALGLVQGVAEHYLDGALVAAGALLAGAWAGLVPDLRRRAADAPPPPPRRRPPGP